MQVTTDIPDNAFNTKGFVNTPQPILSHHSQRHHFLWHYPHLELAFLSSIEKTVPQLPSDTSRLCCGGKRQLCQPIPSPIAANCAATILLHWNLKSTSKPKLSADLNDSQTLLWLLWLHRRGQDLPRHLQLDVELKIPQYFTLSFLQVCKSLGTG